MNRKLRARLTTLVRGGLKPCSPAAFAFAILCVGVATVVRAIADLIVPHAVPFTTYFPAVMVATLAGGWIAGTFALLASVVAACGLFSVQPLFSAEHAVDLTLFVFSAVITLWVSEQFRGVLRRLHEEEQYRQVVVDELGHRVKNKLATIYAILRHELRNQQGIWESVSGRLRALSATDDFLVKSKCGSIGLHRILMQELAPYDTNRVSIAGEPVEIPSKLAVVLSLILHELSTNAAKYGALSAPGGRLDISWHIDGNDIVFAWTETGGPPVDTPTKRSFGTHLIERSLDAFGGKAKIDFLCKGVVCNMRFPKPEPAVNKRPEAAA